MESAKLLNGRTCNKNICPRRSAGARRVSVEGQDFMHPGVRRQRVDLDERFNRVHYFNSEGPPHELDTHDLEKSNDYYWDKYYHDNV